MKKLMICAVAAICCLACTGPKDLPSDAFVRVSGPYLIEPNGDTLFIYPFYLVSVLGLEVCWAHLV